MTIELSSSNKDVIRDLQAIANTDSDNIFGLPISPMEGKEIFTLVIENYAALTTGTAALIIALKTKVDHLKITKNGLELKGASKIDALNGKK